MSKALLVVAGVLALGAAVPTVLAGGSQGSGPGGDAGGVPIKADRDGDRVFDDLESRIAGAACG